MEWLEYWGKSGSKLLILRPYIVPTQEVKTNYIRKEMSLILHENPLLCLQPLIAIPFSLALLFKCLNYGDVNFLYPKWNCSPTRMDIGRGGGFFNRRRICWLKKYPKYHIFDWKCLRSLSVFLSLKFICWNDFQENVNHV